MQKVTNYLIDVQKSSSGVEIKLHTKYPLPGPNQLKSGPVPVFNPETDSHSVKTTY